MLPDADRGLSICSKIGVVEKLPVSRVLLQAEANAAPSLAKAAMRCCELLLVQRYWSVMPAPDGIAPAKLSTNNARKLNIHRKCIAVLWKINEIRRDEQNKKEVCKSYEE